jgi:hypothetical protein
LRGDHTNSAARKWRSALSQLGFLYPKTKNQKRIPQEDIGPLDMISENGRRLLESETVPAMQECFLRALAAYFVPNAFEPQYTFSPFSPLRHVLAILLRLSKKAEGGWLDFSEVAFVVQMTSADDDIDAVVSQVLDFRARRGRAANSKKFDQQEREHAATQHDYATQSFDDYADLNIRYLKATGLLQRRGRGLVLVPEKRVLSEALVADTAKPADAVHYVVSLCRGAALPTDNLQSATAVLNDLLEQLQAQNIQFDVGQGPLKSPADIATVRHRAESILSERKEERYAEAQSAQWEEITAYLDLIASRRSRKELPNGSVIEVPRSEMAAYFEWVLWRAFLAIDSLRNKPFDARRFKVDQDFLPVGTAPGGGPDMIFEFDDFVIAVEVTLTEGSRQAAVEREPVERHVADLEADYGKRLGKPVYGLFIANSIDANTAENFRSRVWYSRDETPQTPRIVPVALSQFRELFAALLRHDRAEPKLIRDLLDECVEMRSVGTAPLWRKEIDQAFSRRTAACLAAQ